MRMKNEFFLNIYDVEALNGLFRLDFTHNKSEDGVRVYMNVSFQKRWGNERAEESFDIGSGILKDDRLVLKVYDDEIPFSMELDRIGVGKILGKSSYKVQDFPDDKVQAFTTQYLDVTDFYRDYMKAKAEQVESSPIDELYIMYDYNVHRRYMTARVGDIWLAEKDVTFRAAEIGNVPEDRAYDYQRYEKAEKIYKAELACIAAQARPMADGLGKPVPVEYRAEDVYFLLLDRDIRLALDAEHQMRKKNWYQTVYAPQYDRFQKESARALDRAAREAGFSFFEENINGNGVRNYTAQGKRKTPQIVRQLQKFDELYDSMVLPVHRNLLHPLQAEAEKFEKNETRQYLRDIMIQTRPKLDRMEPDTDTGKMVGILRQAGYQDAKALPQNIKDKQGVTLPPALQVTVADADVPAVTDIAVKSGFTVTLDTAADNRNLLTIQLPYTLDGHSYRQVRQEALSLVREMKLPAAELQNKQSVDIGADEPMLRQAMDYATGLHGGEAVFSREMTNSRWQRLTDRMTALHPAESQPVERAAEIQARMDLIEQVQLLYNPPGHPQSGVGEYKIRCNAGGGWTFLQELQEEDARRVTDADRFTPAWQDLQKELAAEYFSEYLDELIEMRQQQQQGSGMKR